MIDISNFSEITFSLKHAYAMVYFDKRGSIVRELKQKFPYVNTDTDKNERIVMSTHEGVSENSIQGYFTPSRIWVRKKGSQDINNFYSTAGFWTSTLVRELGVEGYLDGALFTLEYKVDLSEYHNFHNFYKKLGIDTSSYGRRAFGLEMRQTYERNNKFFTLVITEDEEEDGIYDLGLTYLFGEVEELISKGFKKEMFLFIYSELFEEVKELFSEVEEVV